MENQAPDLKRVEEIGPLLERIRGVRRQTRWIRLGFVILILVTILGWTWAIVSHFRSFNLEDFGDALAKRAQKTWPIVADELTKLVEGVLPTVEASLLKELEQAAPQIAERFEQEAHNLDAELKKNIEESLKRHLTLDNRAEAIRIVRAIFPEYGDEAKTGELVASLQDSFLKYAQKKLLTMLAEYYDTLRRFETTFQKIKEGTPPGQAPATLEAVLELWIEVMYEKMGGDSELEAAKPAQKKPAKGRK